MKHKRKGIRMDNYTSQYQNPTIKKNYYKVAYYEYFKDAFKNIVVNNTESKKILMIDENIDNLSFMESFDFPELIQLKVSLDNCGNYTRKQVDEIIAGLSTLPEYRK